MSRDPKAFSELIWGERPRSPLFQGNFLHLRRHRVRNRYADGSTSQWYDFESVHPPFVDAVVLLLHGPGPDPVVALRRGLRPTVGLRNLEPGFAGLDGAPFTGDLWELPAGGVEPPDLAEGGEGVAGRARLEAWEEVGLEVGLDQLHRLGPAPFSAPSYCPERLHYYRALVDPTLAQAPPGDGHPMEEGAQVAFVPLSQGLAMCRQGDIIDLKTEVGLRRLADWLAQGDQA